MSEILNKTIEKVLAAEQAFCRFITINDTPAHGAHQSGFFIPKCAAPLLFNEAFKERDNFDRTIQIKWQDDFVTESRAVYYGRKKNEYRITRLGRGFPFLAEDYVGCLLVIARTSYEHFDAFVLESDEDIEAFFDYFSISPGLTNQLINKFNAQASEEKLEEGIQETISRYADFPLSVEMAALARDIYNKAYKVNDTRICDKPDQYLMHWINTEFGLFQRFEEKIYADTYGHPFGSVQELVKFSNSILNRRKSRAGKSLEHHLATIFTIAQLEFEAQAVTEDNKRPDFLFPSREAYHNLLFPTEDLVFLGAKTTCKDRWRQVLNEANRIDEKYLFTMQQGVTKNQLSEMKHEHLRLVVPAGYLGFFDPGHQADLMTLASFISMVKEKQIRSRTYLMK